MKNHPCLSCGACCAFFRVSFHWSETLPDSYGVPILSTKSISNHLNAMNGTDQDLPYCAELIGNIGVDAICGIYVNRPGACRKFAPSFENGFQHTDCDRARTSKGLSLLSLADWVCDSN